MSHSTCGIRLHSPSARLQTSQKFFVQLPYESNHFSGSEVIDPTGFPSPEQQFTSP